MGLEYNSENKRASLGNDSSPPTENTENKRVSLLYYASNSSGSGNVYLRKSDTVGVYEIVSDQELPELLEFSVLSHVKGVVLDASGDYYIDSSLI